jgi:hypothetical protein
MFLSVVYTHHGNLNFSCTCEAINIQTSPDWWTAVKYHNMTDAVTTCTFFTLCIFTSFHCSTDNVLISHMLETSDIQVTSHPLRKDYYINIFKISRTFTKLDMTNKNMTWKNWHVFSDCSLTLRGLKNTQRYMLGHWTKSPKWQSPVLYIVHMFMHITHILFRINF